MLAELAQVGGALKIVDPTDKSVRATPLARIHPKAVGSDEEEDEE